MPSRLEHRPSDRAREVRQGAHVSSMQRRRLLSAAFELIADPGRAQATTVASLCQRAGVSRKTFYDLFTDREACVAAAFEDALTLAMQAVASRCSTGENWRARMRGALTVLLGLFDERPELARMLIVEALSAGPRVLERRAIVVRDLIARVDEGRTESKSGKTPPPLTAEGVVGAVFSVIHARLLEPPAGGRHLSELTSQLMGLIVHPYLGAAAAEAELATISPVLKPGREELHLEPAPFRDLTIRLTYRTALVLSTIATTPGSSSKQIANAAGVSDEGQMSRLLRRLERNGLVCNAGGEPRRGEAKAWTLTSRGQGILLAAGQA
jgi:AcrR family transcriptional regulator